MKDLLATIELYDDDDTRVGLKRGSQQGRTTAGTFDKVYNMAEIRKLGKELNVSEVIDGVKLDPDKFRSNVTKAKARTDFYKNQFDSLSPKKQKEFKKDFMKQIAKHQDGGFYISAANRVPNAKLVKKYFPKANDANKIVTSINGILLNEFKNKGNVIKTSPKANANAIRVEDMRKITDPSFETFEGVQGTKGASLQHVASKNRMVTLNNLAYMDKVLNSSLSQNDKRIKIIENEVDRLIKAKPKNYVERVNALNNEGMALASGYIKKDGKIVKGPTAGYSEFRIKDPLNEKLSYFGKNDSKTILPDKDPVLIQEDADLINKPVKDYTPTERKRAIEIAKKKQVEFKKIKNNPKFRAKIPLVNDLLEMAGSIPNDIKKAKYLKAGFKTLGIAASPLVIYDTYKAFEQGKPVLESLEAGLIGTDLIGGTKRILALTPEEREARSVVKQDALKDLNVDMPMGFGFIEGPTLKTDMTLEEAQAKAAAGTDRVKELEAQKNFNRATDRANFFSNIRDKIFRTPQSVSFAGGGIAGLSGGIDKGPQRTSMNTDSQGLLSLKNRVRNY